MKRQIRRIWNRVAPFHLDWIQVEVSASCNASCIYCPVSRFGNQRSRGLMEMEVFERLEPTLASTDLAFLQGWGEPLLHPRFWEMVSRAKAKGARVGFGTNGTLLDAECRRRLLASGVDIVGVSVAGATAATHDRLREGCDLETIDARLRELAAEKESAGTERPEVHLAFIMLASNVHELEAVVDLAERWKATELVASNLTLVLDPTLEGEALLAHPERWPEVSTYLRRVKARAEQRGIRFRAYWPDTGEALPLCTENVLSACYVSAGGDVSPCALAAVGFIEGARATHLFQGGEHPLGRFSFGNLRDRDLEEIWRSDAAHSFRKVFRDRWRRFRRGRDGLPPPCRTCYKLIES